MKHKEVEVRDFIDALDGVPNWFLELRHAVEQVDPRAGEVLRDRIERRTDGKGRPIEAFSTDMARRSIAERLMSVFAWDHTPEKHDYWNHIFSKLELADRKRAS